MTQHIGERFGHYRLLRFLGEGTFGDVYYGEHVHHNTPAAIKVFKTKLTPDKFRGFINEVRTVLLKHPNIVEILDFGIGDNDLPYLVMEYAPNGTLLQRHPRGTRLPLATVVPYVKQLAAALQHAHDQSIIHRDIKPENMLFGPNYELLLSDFGLAVVVHSTLSRPTEDKSGTALYMAPEQWQGKPLPATDQYALGIVIYEWLCGEYPFSGGSLQLMYQHIHISPPPLRNKLPTISPEVEQVVMTALAKDPTQRFKRVQAFAVALEEASKSELPPPPKPTITFPLPSTPPTASEQQRQGASDPVAVHPQAPLFVGGMVARGAAPTAADALHSKSTENADPVAPVSRGTKSDSALAPDLSVPPAAPISPPATIPVQANATDTRNGGSSLEPGRIDLPPKQPGITGDSSKAGPAAPVPPPPSPVRRASGQQNGGQIGAVGAGAAAGGILAGRAAAGGGAPPIVHGIPSGARRPGGSPGRRRYGWLLLLLALLLLSLLLCSGVAFAFPKQTQAVATTVTKMVSNLFNPQAPPNTVTITPSSQVVQDSYAIQAVTGTPNAALHQVAARVITASPSQQKTAAATGIGHIPGAQATGTLTFINGNFSAYTIGAGTVFTDASGVQVVNDTPAVIPAATANGQGRTTVAAHVVNAGAAGNIPAFDFNTVPCCGSASVAVSNPDAFTGGQDARTYSFLKQSDIDSVANALELSVLSQAPKSLKSQMRSTEQPATAPQCTPTVSSNEPVRDTGVNISSATVTVSVTCTQEVYDQQGVQALVANLLKAKASTTLGPKYALVGSIVSSVTVQGVDPQTKMVKLLVTAKGRWVYQFSDADKKALAQLIAGLSAEQASAKLQSQPGVESVSLPAGTTSFPKDPTQITITILPVAGFSGGGGRSPISGTPTVTGATVTAPASGSPQPGK